MALVLIFGGAQEVHAQDDTDTYLSPSATSLVHLYTRIGIGSKIAGPITGSEAMIDYSVTGEMVSSSFGHEGGQIPVYCDYGPCTTDLANLRGFMMTLRETMAFAVEFDIHADGWYIRAINAESSYDQSMTIEVNIPYVRNNDGELEADTENAIAIFTDLNGNVIVSGVGGEAVFTASLTGFHAVLGMVTITPEISWIITTIVLATSLRNALENAVETKVTDALEGGSTALAELLASHASTALPEIESGLAALAVTIL